MNKETKAEHFFKIIFLIIFYTSPIIASILAIVNGVNEKEIKQLQTEINSLRFEQQYLEFVKEDNERQMQ